jgi:tRNA(Ile2) C34 agmatinyltransferase TiaS
MKATKEEAEKLNEKWTDFTSGVKDDFVYFTETQESPQYIKVSRSGDKLQINVSTTMNLEKEDISRLTDIFSKSTSAIHKYYAVPGKAGLHVKDKSSSANLLA